MPATRATSRLIFNPSFSYAAIIPSANSGHTWRVSGRDLLTRDPLINHGTAVRKKSVIICCGKRGTDCVSFRYRSWEAFAVHFLLQQADRSRLEAPRTLRFRLSSETNRFSFKCREFSRKGCAVDRFFPIKKLLSNAHQKRSSLRTMGSSICRGIRKRGHSAIVGICMNRSRLFGREMSPRPPP